MRGGGNCPPHYGTGKESTGPGKSIHQIGDFDWVRFDFTNRGSDEMTLLTIRFLHFFHGRCLHAVEKAPHWRTFDLRSVL